MTISTFKKLNKQSGFTLIEVLVSLSIFTMVVTAAVSVLLTMVDANNKAQNLQSAMTNLSFVLDSMTREIRTGSDYYCQNNSASNIPGLSATLPTSGNSTNNCSTGNGNLSFSFNEGGGSITGSCSGSSRIAYRYNPDDLSIERRVCDGDGVLGHNKPADWQRITALEVDITSFQFVVTGTDRTDDISPTVTIYAVGQAGNVIGLETEFAVQTTVTQQALDI